MSSHINIFNLHVNGMTQNASINIGRTLHNSHTANVKLFGANFSMGDCSPTRSQIVTATQDSDISDQGQTEDSASSNSSQR